MTCSAGALGAVMWPNPLPAGQFFCLMHTLRSFGIGGLLCLCLACQKASIPLPPSEAVVYQPQAYVVPSATGLDIYWGWFTWDSITYPPRRDPDRFEILVSSQGPEAWTAVDQVPRHTTHYTLSSLTAGEEIYVAVRALAAGAEPAQSVPLLGMPGALPVPWPLMDRGAERQSGGSWSPDGQVLAYTRWPKDTLLGPSVYLHTFATGKSLLLGPGQYPVWAPEGGSIAYLAPAGDGLHFLTLFSGGGGDRLTPEAAAYRHLAWSPDARQLLYEVATPEPEPIRLGLFSLADGLRELSLSGRPAYTTWHPQGQRLAFARPHNATGWDLYTYDPDTHQEQVLLQSVWEETRPAFSPDGTQLAFVSDRSGLPAIWVMDLASAQLQQLTDGLHHPLPPHHRRLAWDPAGRQILFTAQVDSAHHQLFVVPVER
jgi:Tol biopolymer transport system component